MSYSYIDAKLTPIGVVSSGDAPSADARPHTVAAAILFAAPGDSRTLGGLLARSGIYADLRIATGTAYTPCPTTDPSDASVLSGELCTLAVGGGFNSERLPTVKLVDLRVTKGIAFGSITITAFADVRNLLNARNVQQVFTQTGKTSNAIERNANRQADLNSYAGEAQLNSLRQTDGTIDLTFGGGPDPRGGCDVWMTSDGKSGAPNCVYLIGAEQRFGNGDHLFTLAEQTRASDAFYYTFRGLQNFTGPGRRVRLGVAIDF